MYCGNEELNANKNMFLVCVCMYMCTHHVCMCAWSPFVFSTSSGGFQCSLAVWEKILLVGTDIIFNCFYAVITPQLWHHFKLFMQSLLLNFDIIFKCFYAVITPQLWHHLKLFLCSYYSYSFDIIFKCFYGVITPWLWHNF